MLVSLLQQTMPNQQLFSDLALPYAASTPSLPQSRFQSQKGSLSVIDAIKQANGTNQRMKVDQPLSNFARNLPSDQRHDFYPVQMLQSTPSKGS